MVQRESNSDFLGKMSSGDQLTLRSPTFAEQRFFLSAGYAHLEDLWSVELAAAIADEARSRWRFAEIPKQGPRTPVVGYRVSHRVTKSATGPLLTSLHFSLVGFVRSLTGRLLVPTFSAYGYYDINDNTLLHLDQERCHITLLTTALGKVGPLHLHPELQGKTMEELGAIESDPEWNHASGFPVVYPSKGVTALSGNILPHNRPGMPVSELSAVGALCYRSLF